MVQKLLYESYPGIVEIRRLIEFCGFKNDVEACEWIGLHKFYIRDRLIIRTVDAKVGADIPEHLLVLFRIAFKFQSVSKGNLLELTTPYKKLTREEIFKKAKKVNISIDEMLELGAINDRVGGWATRYIELTVLLRKKEKDYPWFKGVTFLSYLQQIGLKTADYSLLTKIPQPNLVKKGVELPAYQIRLAELMYRYVMTEGVNIDVNKPLEINIQKIFWQDKAETLETRNRYQVALNNNYQQKRKATSKGNENLIKELELKIEEKKEIIAQLDEELSYTPDEQKQAILDANMSYAEIEHHAQCVYDKIVWRGRALPWAVCFARLYNLYIKAGGEKF